MITPLIEKYLLAGTAKWHSHPIYLTGTAKIEVPVNKFIVITDLHIYPVIKTRTPTDELGIIDIVDRYSILQIDLFGKNLMRNSFLVRNNFEGLKWQGDGAAYIKNSEPQHFDILQVSEEDVYVNVLRFQGIVNNGGTDFGNLSRTQLPKQPVAYGTTQPTLKTLVMEDGAQYVPNGQDEIGGGTIATDYTTKAISRANFGGLIPTPSDPDNEMNNNQILMNIFYVEFNLQTKKDFI